MGFSVNQESRTFLTDPVLIFSGKENSRSFPTIDDDIELDSFTDAAIVETTESKATKSKIKTEVEHSGSLYRLLPTMLNSTVLLMLLLMKRNFKNSLAL